MKKCPYCAEEIQNEAIYCRYCKHEFIKPPVDSQVKKPPKISCIAGCATVIVVIVGLIILMSVYLVIDQYRKENASIVEIHSDYVSGLLLVDRPISIVDTPEPGVDFIYTGEVSIGQRCNVIGKQYYKSELHYNLNCNGTIGWLPAENTIIVR